MISNEFLQLLDDCKRHRHTDYTTFTECLIRLQDEWKQLYTLYASIDFDIMYISPEFETLFSKYLEIKDILFNMARRGFEICAMLDERGKHRDVFAFIDEARDLHIRKNAGYSGDSMDSWKNFRECTKFGISSIDGCTTRLCDKFSRFFTVLENPDNDQVGESLLDSMLDFSNYSLILYCLLDEERK